MKINLTHKEVSTIKAALLMLHDAHRRAGHRVCTNQVKDLLHRFGIDVPHVKHTEVPDA